MEAHHQQDGSITKCCSNHQLKIPVIFHIATYIVGLEKNHYFSFVQYRAAL